jgi:hypothetical protein
MATSNAQALPFAVRRALVQACGRVFYYKGGLLELFVSAGVPAPMVQRYIDEELVKFQIARNVLDDLDTRGPSGHRIQNQVLDAILGLDGPADEGADEKEAKKALEDLRKAAGRSLSSDKAAAAHAAVAARKQKEELQRRATKRQAEKVEALFSEFIEMSAMNDHQKRGYALEGFLKNLFHASDLDYRGSYKVGVEQIDGAFKHASRDFLVEARWREEPPGASDLYAFAYKVEGKLQGTLGLFISMVPPRDEVLDQVATVTKNVLIMDGSDMALILEGRFTLPEALEIKRRRAAHEGKLFARLADQ